MGCVREKGKRGGGYVYGGALQPVSSSKGSHTDTIASTGASIPN